jgi:hypothetical protein
LGIINARGLNDKYKRSIIRSYCYDHFDVVFFTETHATPQSAKSFFEFPNAIYAGNSTNSLGVAVWVVRPETRVISASFVERDSEGRFLDVTLSWNDRDFHTRIIYAPDKTNMQEHWFTNVLPDSSLGTFDLLVGDFNCIANPQQDQCGMVQNAKGYEWLEPTLEDMDLVDAWHLRGSGVGGTWRPNLHVNPPRWARYDRCYIGAHLSTLVHRCEVLADPGVTLDRSVLNLHASQPNMHHQRCSDHLPLYVELRDNPPNEIAGGPSKITKGRDFKRVNPWVFHDPTFIKHLHHDLKLMYSALEHTDHSASIVWERMKQLLSFAAFVRQSNRVLPPKLHLVFQDLVAACQKHDLTHLDSFAIWENMAAFTQAQYQEDLCMKAGVNFDANSAYASSYLTRRIHARAAQTCIDCVFDESDELCDTNDTISAAVRSFYQRLYAAEPISARALQRLLKHWKPFREVWKKVNVMKEITEADVMSAISSGNSAKAPGPDGLGYSAYKPFADVLAKPLARLFNRFLQGDDLPEHMKRGIITILYKGKGDVRRIENRRPITLLDVDYKIFSTIIASRLQEVAKLLISQPQNGFIRGRWILDNVVTMNEVFRSTRQYNQGHQQQWQPVVTLIDFVKAFDRVAHRAILEVFKHTGAPTAFIVLVSNMLSGVLVQVLVNGNLTADFHIGRGTRQGDPLSPLLFVFVIETLSRAVQSHSDIRGIKISTNVEVRIELVADDVALVALDWSSFNKQIALVQRYCAGTGAMVNDSKCVCLLPGGLPVGCDSPNQLPFPVASQSGSQYLGIPIGVSGIMRRAKDALRQAYSDAVNFKSYAYSLYHAKTLFNTYLFSKLVYCMTVDVWTNAELKRLERLATNFVFGRVGKDKFVEPSTRSTNTSDEDDEASPSSYDAKTIRYWTPVSIERLTRPQRRGGIGVVHPRAVYWSLHIRWITRALTVPTQWSESFLEQIDRLTGPNRPAFYTHPQCTTSLPDDNPLLRVCIQAYSFLDIDVPDLTLEPGMELVPLRQDQLRDARHIIAAVDIERKTAVIWDGYQNKSVSFKAIQKQYAPVVGPGGVYNLLAYRKCRVTEVVRLQKDDECLELPWQHKDLYELVRRQLDNGRLTEGQLANQRNFHFKYKHVFRELSPLLLVRHKVQELWWRLLNNAVAKKHGDKCHKCGERESHLHIFFQCKDNKPVLTAASELYRHWFTDAGRRGEDLDPFEEDTFSWTVKNVLGLQLMDGSNRQIHANFIASVLWALWTARNRQLHDHLIPTAQAARAVILQEMARAANVLWQRIRAGYRRMGNVDKDKLKEKTDKFKKQWMAPEDQAGLRVISGMVRLVL